MIKKADPRPWQSDSGHDPASVEHDGPIARLAGASNTTPVRLKIAADIKIRIAEREWQRVRPNQPNDWLYDGNAVSVNAITLCNASCRHHQHPSSAVTVGPEVSCWWDKWRGAESSVSQIHLYSIR